MAILGEAIFELDQRLEGKYSSGTFLDAVRIRPVSPWTCVQVLNRRSKDHLGSTRHKLHAMMFIIWCSQVFYFDGGPLQPASVLQH